MEGAPEAQEAAIFRWFGDKWPDPACAVCGERAWAANPRLGQIPNLAPPAQERGRTVPIVVITCFNCGHTVSVNAIVAGVVASDDEPEEPEKQVGLAEDTT